MGKNDGGKSKNEVYKILQIMPQYVNKDALVAEIERRIKSINSCPFRTAELGSEKLNEGQLKAYNAILSFLDTTEVKEVDSLTSEEIKKICTIYDNLNQERNRGAVLYNSDETFFNHVLMEYKVIAQKGE